MNELGDFIKELRLEKSLSIRKASEEIGISHTYLDSLEKGYDPRTKKERKPTPEVLKRISSYYDVPYIDLMAKAGYVDDKGNVPTDSLGEAFGFKPSEIEKAKQGNLVGKSSSANMFNALIEHLDNEMKKEGKSESERESIKEFVKLTINRNFDLNE